MTHLLISLKELNQKQYDYGNETIIIDRI